jgi:cytoskeletal protein RodZ
MQEAGSMAEQKTLKKALRQMSEGSKSGFRTFYLGSIQYIYSSARLLYDTHEDACRFVVDVYQYLYLHLPEYDMSQDLQGWISKIIRERYLQLSIGKQRTPSPLGHPIATSTLTKEEQERLWHILDLHIRFPKEHQPLSTSKVLLIISCVLLVILLASRYVPTIAEKLSDTGSLSNDAQENSDGDTGDGSSTDDTEAADDSSDMDEINDLLQQINSDKTSEETTNDGDLSGMTSQQDTTNTQESSGTSPTVTEPTIDTPTVEEPTIDEPTVETPTAPSSSNSSSSSSSNSQNSDSEDLENMELELYYGDSLKYADDN